MITWSYSFLRDFENCARKAHHRYVLRDLPKEPDSPEQIHGNAVHRAMENRLRRGAELPPEYGRFEKWAEAFDRDDLKLHLELGLGLKRDLTPWDFFGPEVWGRTRADVIALKLPEKTSAVYVDWKTGKPREDELQMLISALFVFEHYKTVEKVTAFAVWLEHDRIGEQYTYHRAKLGPLWGMVLSKLRAVEATEASGVWLAKPNPLCAWCPVRSCEHNRSDQRAAAHRP